MLAAGGWHAKPSAMGGMSGKIRILELWAFEVVHPGSFDFFCDITLLQSMPWSELWVFVFVPEVFEKWRCATGKKRECRLRKCDVRGHLRPTFEAGAPGVAEGEKRRRWEASEGVIVEQGDGCSCGAPSGRFLR